MRAPLLSGRDIGCADLLTSAGEHCIQCVILQPCCMQVADGAYRGRDISRVKGSVCIVLKFALPPFSPFS